jgi:hypothetical protein
MKDLALEREFPTLLFDRSERHRCPVCSCMMGFSYTTALSNGRAVVTCMSHYCRRYVYELMMPTSLADWNRLCCRIGIRTPDHVWP